MDVIRQIVDAASERLVQRRRRRWERATPRVVDVGAQPPVDVLQGEDAELDKHWARRLKVKTLRLRGMTQTQIAEALQVGQATVSRDLAWIRQHRRDMYGEAASFDPTQEIGEAVDLFEAVEMSALRDYHRLPTDNVKDRNACLRTVVFTRLSRLNVLMDQGILERKIGTVGIAIRADAVRATLVKEGLLSAQGQQHAKALPDDFDAWLKAASG